MKSKSVFPSMFVSVVLGLVFLVMGVAFLTMPYKLSSHPGELQRTAAQHLT